MAITDRTRKILWVMAGGRCSICRVQLVTPGSAVDDPSTFGQEAHIVSSKPHGPRARPIADPDVYDNLILLCSRHHKQIDDQVASYPEDRVRQIKRDHETWTSSITSDPTHPMGIRIYGRSLRNEESGTIRAEGPGAFIELGVDDMVNAGTVITSQNGSGTRLADHLRVIADHIYADARSWDQAHSGERTYSTFLAQYVNYGRAHQAVELYDSAMRYGLETPMARADFEKVISPDTACQVADELVRWAEELDQRRLNGA